MTDLPAQLRAAADESKDRWADMTELHGNDPAFRKDSGKAAAHERLLEAAADYIEQVGEVWTLKESGGAWEGAHLIGLFSSRAKAQAHAEQRHRSPICWDCDDPEDIPEGGLQCLHEGFYIRQDHIR